MSSVRGNTGETTSASSEVVTGLTCVSSSFNSSGRIKRWTEDDNEGTIMITNNAIYTTDV